METKTKLLALLEKIKSAILELDASDAKREALLSKLAALEEEIQRDRTRWEIAGAFWVAFCGVTGEGIEKLEPARKWVDSVGKLFGLAKSDEAPTPMLPRSEPQKRIEGPKDVNSGSVSDVIDDDIPF